MARKKKIGVETKSWDELLEERGGSNATTSQPVGVETNSWDSIISQRKEIGRSMPVVQNNTSKYAQAVQDNFGSKIPSKQERALSDYNRLNNSQKAILDKRENRNVFEKAIDAIGNSEFSKQLQRNAYNAVGDIEGAKAVDENMKKSNKTYSALRKTGMSDSDIDYYMENYGTMKEYSDTDKYYKKRSAALSKIDTDTYKQLNEYNQAEQVGTSLTLTGEPSQAQTNALHERYQKRDEILKKTGWSVDEFEKNAQYVREVENKNANAKNVADSRKMAKDSVGSSVAANALTIPLNAIGGVMAGAEKINSLFYADKDAPVDTNSILYQPQNMSDEIRNTTAEELENATSNKAVNAVLKYGYQGGMAAADSALLTAGIAAGLGDLGVGAEAAQHITAGLVDADFFVAGYAKGLKQANDEGLGGKKANQYAIAQGLNEAVSEIISLDMLAGMFARGGKTALVDGIKSALKQAGIEGSEEVFGDILNTMADNYINNDFSDYNQSIYEYKESGMTEEHAKSKARMDKLTEMRDDFITGAISGGLGAGSAHIMTRKAYTGIGEKVNQDKSQVAKIVEAVKGAKALEGTTAKQIFDNKDVENISDADLGRAIQSMQEVAGNEVREVFTSELESKGLSKGNASEVASKLADFVEGNNKSINVTNESKDAVSEVLQDFADHKLDKQLVVNTAIREVGNTLSAEEYKKQATELRSSDKYAAESMAMKYAKQAPVTVAGNNARIKSIASTGSNPMVKLDNGKTVSLDQVEFESPKMQELYSAASSMENVNVANSMLEYASGIPVETMREAGKQFFDAGKLNLGYEDVLNNPKNAKFTALFKGEAEEAFLKQVYMQGQNASEELKPTPKADTSNLKKNAKFKNKSSEKYSKEQEQFFSAVAKLVKNDITVEDFLRDNANHINENILGSHTKGQISLANKKNNNIVVTTFHEAMENLEVANPQAYRDLKKEVMATLQSNMGMELLDENIKSYQKAYQKVEGNKSLEDASNELFNDIIGQMFTTKQGVEAIVNETVNDSELSAPRKEGVLENIKDIAGRMIKAIKGLMKSKGQASWVHRYISEKEAADIVNKAMAAFKNTGVKESKVSESEKTETKHSVAVDSEGRTLTEDQRKYFADSKVRDEQGRLQVVYHGTLGSQINIFDNKISKDKRSLFFTSNPEVSETYAGENGTVMPAYLNLKDPVIIDAEGSNWYRVKYDSKGKYKVEPTTLFDFNFLTPQAAEKFDKKNHLTEINNVLQEAQEKGTATYNDEEYDEYDAEDLFNDAIEDAYKDYQKNYHNDHKRLISFRDFFDNSDKYTIVDLASMLNGYDSNAPSLLELLGEYEYEDLVEETKENFERMIEEGEEEADFFDSTYGYVLPIMDDEYSDDLYANTRRISEMAQKAGKDGVIIKNIYDAKTGAAILSDVFIAYNSNQVKSVDNEHPTNNEDIRYSVDVDSEGRKLTKDQQKYFADSKIRDEQGRLKVMYHGTDQEFYTFKPVEFGGKNQRAEGYGIYLSDSKEVMEMYGAEKGHVLYANIKNPASRFEKNINKDTLIKLIKDICMDEAKQAVADEEYDNINDALKDTFVSNYVFTYDKTMDEAYSEVAEQILSQNSNDADIVQEMMLATGVNNYETAYEFYDLLTDSIGIDGIITRWGKPDGEEINVVLAFDSNQLKLVTNEHPTDNQDIRYSLDVEYESAYKKNDVAKMEDLVAKAARAAGYNSPKLYHGTQSFGFTKFDLNRMDDKQTIFLTSNPEIASTYSGSRQKKRIDEKSDIDLYSIPVNELADRLNESLPDDGIPKHYEYYNAEKFRELDDSNKAEVKKIGDLISKIISEDKYEEFRASTQYNAIQRINSSLNTYSVDELLHGKGVRRDFTTDLYMLAKHSEELDDDIRKAFGEIEKNIRKAYGMYHYFYNLSKDMEPSEDGIICEDSLNGYMFELLRPWEARQELGKQLDQGIYSLYAKLNNTLVIDADNKNWNNLTEWPMQYIKKYNIDNTQAFTDNGRAYLTAGDEILLDVNAGDYYTSLSDDELHRVLIEKFPKAFWATMGRDYGFSTRGVVKFAKIRGYDSVIFKNIIDNGGRNSSVENEELADVYAFFRPEDVKSADAITYDDKGNVIPPSERFTANNEDIRYSVAVDSKGHKLSQEQQDFFKDSKIRDEEGRLLVVYHGSTDKFYEFDENKIGQNYWGWLQFGRGYYFSGTKKEAKMFAKLAAKNNNKSIFNRNVRAFYLDIKNPFIYGESEKNFDSFEDYKTNDRPGSYVLDREKLITYGYDGVVFKKVLPDEEDQYIAFYPSQIKLVSNKKPTENNDIRFSIAVDSEGYELSQGQQDYFKDSQARDKDGNLKVYYHGTNRKLGFTVFNPETSDDKISLFFTDNLDVAFSYGNTKEEYNPYEANDILGALSKIRESKSIEELNEALKLFLEHGHSYRVEKTGWYYEFFADDDVDEKLSSLNFDYLKEQIEYYVGNENGASGVYNVYLNATNPLIVNANEKLWNQLEPIVPITKHYYDVEVEENADGTFITYHENGEEKTDSSNNYDDLYAFYREYGITDDDQDELFESDYLYLDDIFLDANGKRTSEFGKTRDYAKYAKENGYDSVIFNDLIDYGMYGVEDTPSQVVVVFNSNQVKSIHNENPTENDDIRYSLSVDQDDIWMDIMEQADSDYVAKTSAIIEEGNRLLQDGTVKVTKMDAKRVAADIIDKYQSNANQEELAENIRKVFAYAKENPLSPKDFASIMQAVAMPVVSELKFVDDSMEQEYKNFKKFFKGMKIKLDAPQKAEVENYFDSYNEYRKVMQKYGIVLNLNVGTSLDDVWSEIVEASGNRLSEAENSANQPIALLDYLKDIEDRTIVKSFERSAKDAPVYEGATKEEAAYGVAMDIIGNYYKYVAGEKLETDEATKYIKLNNDLQALARKEKARGEREFKKAVAEAAQEELGKKLARVKHIEAEIAEAKAKRGEAISSMDELTRLAYEELIKTDSEKVAAIRKQKNDEIAKIKAKQRRTKENDRARRKTSELKKKVERNYNTLSSMVANPTETKHIPFGVGTENMVNAVIDVLELINLNKGNGSRTFADKMAKLQEKYDALKDNAGFDYDANTASMIATLKNAVLEEFSDSPKMVRELRDDELQTILDITNQLITQIRNENKLINNKKTQDAYEASTGIIEETKKSRIRRNPMTELAEKILGTKTVSKVQDAANKYFTWHLNAERWFNKVSGYKKDGFWKSIYQSLDDGQLKMLAIERDINKIFESVLEGKENQKDVARLHSTKAEDMVDIGLKDDAGKPVMVTRAMRLALIMHSYNDDNLRHVLGDGLTIPDMELYEKGRITDAYNKGKTYRYIPYDDYLMVYKTKGDQRNAAMRQLESEITSAKEFIKGLEKSDDFTDYEKRFLTSAKKMFHEYTGGVINNTSQVLKGYKIARVKNYFPIKSDPNFTKQDYAGLVRDGSIEGMGFLKNRVASKNPILLEDITNVILRQTNNTALYGGMAIPIRNLNMVLNITSHDANGYNQSVKSALAQTWGETDNKFLKNLITDLQMGRHQDPTIFDSMRSKFAGATLTLNLGVAIKQAASYPTAAAVVGWKPLGRAFADFGKGFIKAEGIEELEKRNPLLWKRSQGYSTQELGDIKDNRGWGEKITSKIPGANMIQFVDTGTVRTLEYAAKYYVDEQFKDLEKGSDEYWDKVSEVFTNIVQRTQPNYTTLQRPDMLRTPNQLIKQLAMFKTQPLQNFGIMYDAMAEYGARVSDERIEKSEASTLARKEAGKNLAKAVSSQVVAAAVFSLMTIAADMVYHKQYKYMPDDDEDKTMLDKMLESFFKGLGSTFSGMLFLGDTLYSALSYWLTGDTYYGLEVSVTGMINDVVDGVANLQSSINKLNEANTDEEAEKAQKKVMQQAKKIFTTAGEFAGIPANNIIKTFDSIVLYGKDIATGSAPGTSEEWIYSETESMKDRYLDAYNDNDQKEMNRIKEQIAEDKDKTEEEAAKYVNNWVTSEEWDKVETEVDKVLAGKASSNKAVVASVSEIYSTKKSVSDEKSAKSSVSSSITSKYKNKYLELLKTDKTKAAKLQNVIISMYMAIGYSKADAMKKIKNWTK